MNAITPPPHTTGLHTGNTAPFLYTPTSLLPEHSVITDVQQATGRNRQQWITCRSGGQTIKPKIWFGHNELNLTSSTSTSATIGLGNHSLNGLYHCLSSQSQREFFSLFFRNSGNIQYMFSLLDGYLFLTQTNAIRLQPYSCMPLDCKTMRSNKNNVHTYYYGRNI